MSPLSVVLIPFVGAVLIGLAAKSPRLRDALSWITAIAFFGGIISQIGPVLEGAGRSQTVWTLLPGDRKSTRLNSSHVATSYAVFCLKKKKITASPSAINPSTSQMATASSGSTAPVTNGLFIVRLT